MPNVIVAPPHDNKVAIFPWDRRQECCGASLITGDSFLADHESRSTGIDHDLCADGSDGLQ